MHHKSTKNLGYKATKVGKDFTSEKLTCYSGLTVECLKKDILNIVEFCKTALKL